MERITYNELPEGFLQPVMQVQHYTDNCGLDIKLLELLRFRVSQINSCAYCLDMHYKEAVHAGEDPLRLLSVSAWRETNYYSPAEKAALAFAEILTHMPSEEPSDAIHDELKKHFSKLLYSFIHFSMQVKGMASKMVFSAATTVNSLGSGLSP